MKKYLTLDQASNYANVSKTRIVKWCDKYNIGELVTVGNNIVWRIESKKLKEFLDENYKNKVTIKQIMNYTGWTRQQAHRICKDIKHKIDGACLVDMRELKKLLENNDG